MKIERKMWKILSSPSPSDQGTYDQEITHIITMFVNDSIGRFLDDVVGVGVHCQECQDSNQISHHCFEVDHFEVGSW